MLLTLTTDSCGSLVDSGYLGVHLDHVCLPLDLGVALVDLFLDPFHKGLPRQGVDDVGDVSSGQLVHLPLDHGEGVHDFLWSPFCPCYHKFYTKTLEKWNRDRFDILGQDHGSFPGHEVSHMEYGNCLIWREINAGFTA